MNLLMGSELGLLACQLSPCKPLLSLPSPQKPTAEQEVAGHKQGSLLAQIPVPKSLGHSPQSLCHFTRLESAPPQALGSRWVVQVAFF